jgi:hypothetical protein
MPDHMLLKKGDSWSGETIWWSKSGRNSQEPMLLGSYGSGERPIVKTGDKMGFYTGHPIHDVAVTGIHFTASTRNPDSPDYNWDIHGTYGIQVAGSGSNILIEDNLGRLLPGQRRPHGFNGKLSNITFRKNVVANSWSTGAISSGGKSQGPYIADVNGVTVEGQRLRSTTVGTKRSPGAGPDRLRPQRLHVDEQHRRGLPRQHLGQRVLARSSGALRRNHREQPVRQQRHPHGVSARARRRRLAA